MSNRFVPHQTTQSEPEAGENKILRLNFQTKQIVLDVPDEEVVDESFIETFAEFERLYNGDPLRHGYTQFVLSRH